MSVCSVIIEIYFIMPTITLNFDSNNRLKVRKDTVIPMTFVPFMMGLTMKIFRYHDWQNTEYDCYITYVEQASKTFTWEMLESVEKPKHSVNLTVIEPI